MKILATQFTLERSAFEIYLSGCAGNCGKHCDGCHNPESWDFNNGIEYDTNYFLEIKNKVKTFDSIIENIMIFGGEPNDNDKEELKNFLIDMKSLNKKIWLFTRYYKEELPQFEFTLCDYIKCGEYNNQLLTNNNEHYGINLATKNQYIIKKGVDY